MGQYAMEQTTRKGPNLNGNQQPWHIQFTERTPFNRANVHFCEKRPPIKAGQSIQGVRIDGHSQRPKIQMLDFGHVF